MFRNKSHRPLDTLANFFHGAILPVFGVCSFDALLDLCFAIALFALPVSPVFGQQISYTYDEAGRLVGVVDPSGNGAAYRYDAVGNMLSIQHFTAGQVAIFDFTPNSGPIGTTVIVKGMGFSGTPSQNVLTFHGASASIVSSSPTQIIALVPSSASSGPIAVTSSIGNATTSNQFTVTGSSAPPFIASFSPTILGAGGSINISGGNFAATPLGNDVRLNVGLLSVSSASNSTLIASIPSNATSGRITVSTNAGSVVSNGDLFVQPPGQVVLSGSTVRGALGSSASVSIPGGGYTGLIIFDGVQSQHASVKLAGSGACSSLTGATATLLDPMGNAVGYGHCYDATGGFIDSTPLLVSGTYTLNIQSESATVNTTASLYNVVDFSASVSVNGAPLSISLATPGQNAVLTFSGAQGQQVTINASSNTNCEDWSITDPTGNLIYGSSQCAASFSISQVLSVGGVYSIHVNPGGAATPSFGVALTTP